MRERRCRRPRLPPNTSGIIRGDTLGLLAVAGWKKGRSGHRARQQHKGMSWSPTGSKALGILRVVELNQQWEQLGFPQRAAA